MDFTTSGPIQYSILFSLITVLNFDWLEVFIFSTGEIGAGFIKQSEQPAGHDIVIPAWKANTTVL